MKPCLAPQPLGCGAALQLRTVVPTPAVLWAWLCPAAPAAPLLLLPDYICCCSHDEFCRLLRSYRSQEACQDKHARPRLCRVLLLMAGTQQTRSLKWAAGRRRGRAKKQSGADKMLLRFLLSAHNLRAKCQRGKFSPWKVNVILP